MNLLPPKVTLTRSQELALDEARVSFMIHCPFFCHYFYDQMVEHPTLVFPTAATDGKRLFYNPDYVAALKVLERCFLLAHETYHAVWRHPTRVLHYLTTGQIEGLPF